MRNRFGEQLERLHVEMIQMGALCEDAISAAAQALMKGDEDLARAAGEAEREIDQKEREVEMGSRALVDSSISRISGSTAKARAMHSRCCWPPERPRALFFSRSFTSSQMAAPRRDCSTISSSFTRLRIPWVRGP